MCRLASRCGQLNFLVCNHRRHAGGSDCIHGSLSELASLTAKPEFKMYSPQRHRSVESDLQRISGRIRSCVRRPREAQSSSALRSLDWTNFSMQYVCYLRPAYSSIEKHYAVKHSPAITFSNIQQFYAFKKNEPSTRQNTCPQYRVARERHAPTTEPSVVN
ncbi:uncharacterized protein K460DRAFT_138318 [Cucurbitaria berberidis CBS 394.84]|uniref:Uncharacterized protein n=1 Tax=Cucurbitaria berberidis CBS 394.84 TaxID=1168544 RepID=A0A9P4GCS2_9PLEO|nr:uncharacterized protein K460DRAFT_138318 [Cucurbitaria berberidis CBS 394.84]KAF1843027.1 hypothetical protein K460DRAFT_138318 [Cucurbitaria berberidis CBS 394.84]